MVERIPMDKARTLAYQSTSQENGAGAGRGGVSRATRSMDDEIIDYSDEELSMVPRPVKKPERVRRTAMCRDAPLDLKLGKRGRGQEVDELSDRLRTSRVSDAAAAAAADGGAKRPSPPAALSSPPAYDDSVISGYKKSQHHDEHEEQSRSDGESYGWIATSFESPPADLLRMVPLKKLRTNF